MNIEFINASHDPEKGRSVTLSADRGVWERICTINERFLTVAEDDAADIALTPMEQITGSLALIRDNLTTADNKNTVEVEFPRELFLAMSSCTVLAASLHYDVVPGTSLPLDPEEFEQIENSLLRVNDEELAVVSGFTC